MSKRKKKQIIQKADALSKAIDAVYFMCQMKQMNEASDLLVQMQQLAIEIGTTIEQYEELHSCEIVKKLEALCEKIYEINNNLSKWAVFSNLYKQTKNSIIEIIDDMQHTIMVKWEIVFLPYQVSMWDSLESVWMCADADKDTECYVVPIPYYDVLPDHSIGMMHYDGARYPDYVKVTDYQNYDLQEHQPDVIFFHNPYDDFNLITRVPEQFYSSQLKQCTDLLVYIPYLISEEWGPADHQCYTPGVLFSDRVVVQPGKIYEKYCSIYTQTLKENGWTEKLVSAEEKFLPLGSPKMDKIWNIRCEMEDLPEEWRHKILKKDGTKKKIVLYNTTIVDLLRENEKMLQKIEAVFHEFKNRQADFVMMWRPHPLLFNTINAMRPQLRDQYLARVQEIKESEWGIFDETPDPNLSMALADAYYGDLSSLLIVWQQTGKPMMLQNVEINESQYQLDRREQENYKINSISDVNVSETYCKEILYEDGSFYYNLPVFLECIQRYCTKMFDKPEKIVGDIVYKKIRQLMAIYIFGD